MNLAISKSILKNKQNISITGSKSETNRALLLQALYPNITIENTSNSDDSEVMIKALNSQFIINNSQLIDVHHAGTAMRFLTAFFAVQENVKIVLTGSERMQQRPIKILVDALRELGADIKYLKNEGFPPIQIKGKKVKLNDVQIDANVSSQYISALLLIAPKLENGLTITLNGTVTSVPYIKMTLALLSEIGIQTSFENNSINIQQQFTIHNSQLTIESDWSSASYFYSIIALSEIGNEITLSSYKKNSLQGDSILVEIYKNFGVKTVFNDNHTISISKTSNSKSNSYNFQLNDCPDIAQTIAVTCFGLGIACELNGLHTLKIKETDRLAALKNELTKLGAKISITDDSLHLENSNIIVPNCSIKTYQDHRMAMAFAPLALKTSLIIEDAEVVSKSYPNFWNDLKQIGFEIKGN